MFTTKQEALERAAKLNEWSRTHSQARTAYIVPENMELLQDDRNQTFILEGLQCLLDVKLKAHRTVTNAGQTFTEKDFGIPEVRQLIQDLSTVFYGEEGDETSN